MATNKSGIMGKRKFGRNLNLISLCKQFAKNPVWKERNIMQNTTKIANMSTDARWLSNVKFNKSQI